VSARPIRAEIRRDQGRKNNALFVCYGITF
jgi:hypothetical protein